MGSEGLQARYINPYTDFAFKLFDAAEIARLSAEKRYEYEESLKAYRDWNNSLDTAKNKGIAIGWEKGKKEGLEEGKREGLEEGKKAIAKAMKAEGMPIASILRITGLTEEDIKEL